jgi:hypothetical protein
VILEGWWIEIPGLTAERAERIREDLLPESPYGVLLIDPNIVMARGYNRNTVELLARFIEVGLEDATLSREERMGALSMLEDYRDWLASTA